MNILLTTTFKCAYGWTSRNNGYRQHRKKSGVGRQARPSLGAHDAVPLCTVFLCSGVAGYLRVCRLLDGDLANLRLPEHQNARWFSGFNTSLGVAS